SEGDPLAGVPGTDRFLRRSAADRARRGSSRGALPRAALTAMNQGGVANWPGNGLASLRRWTSLFVQGNGLVPRSLKIATPITPTFRVSPVLSPAYEFRTEPNRKAATVSVLCRKPSTSTSPRGSTR